jgi:murein DD-endopeptidase MepM/ murein hydrolase activator NlpD
MAGKGRVGINRDPIYWEFCLFAYSQVLSGMRDALMRLRVRHGTSRIFTTVCGFAAGIVIAVSLTSTGVSAPENTTSEKAAPEHKTAALVAPEKSTGARPMNALPFDVEPAALARPARWQTENTVAIQPGDTLMNVLVRAGLTRTEADNAIRALAKLYSPRRLRPGQELSLNITSARDDAAADGKPTTTLTALTFHASVEEDVEVRRNERGGFVARKITHPLRTRHQRAVGTITDSLFLAAQRYQLPTPVLLQLVQLFSFDVDFQRDIQSGDHFEVLFESKYTEDGELARHGDILFARLTLSGTDVPLYRFVMANGDIDYFNEKGESVRKALMKTPIDGARLSSRYGRRKHPILGYTRMHRGVDFAARRGTPVMAAGDGKIDYAGRKGGYGKYVRIRHNSDYKTAYAHLHKYGRGIRGGKRVRQGQIIGYVGSTGRSTGPHLHYEILRNNRQINPLGLKLPSGIKLKGKRLARFQHERGKLDIALANAPLIGPFAANDIVQ